MGGYHRLEAALPTYLFAPPAPSIKHRLACMCARPGSDGKKEKKEKKKALLVSWPSPAGSFCETRRPIWLGLVQTSVTMQWCATRVTIPQAGVTLSSELVGRYGTRLTLYYR